MGVEIEGSTLWPGAWRAAACRVQGKNGDDVKLRDMLGPACVSFETGLGTQKQVFEKLGERLSVATGMPAAMVTAALAAREKLGTTGFGGATAIPHGRLPGTTAIHAAVMRLQNPVEWQAVDGAPVDIVVALVGPEDAGADHLKALALVSRTLRDRAFMDKLRGATDGGALWALLTGEERRAA